ncbi:MAG: ABC transporter ATP-binding protein, partial [Thaumarchaeota archaeon]|nr:ABC transporter ATP-binding protein [Nitrososphaerota archaeon]
GLSPGETIALMNLASELNRRGTTIIVISHDMWVITKYCSRTLLIGAGEIILDGPTREVFSNDQVLSRNNIQPPQVVDLSRKLFGSTCLTVDEFVQSVSMVRRAA